MQACLALRKIIPLSQQQSPAARPQSTTRAQRQAGAHVRAGPALARSRSWRYCQTSEGRKPARTTGNAGLLRQQSDWEMLMVINILGVKNNNNSKLKKRRCQTEEGDGVRVDEI